MRYGRIKLLPILLCTVFLFSGCGNSIPGLSDEEISVVSSYASDSILQYSTKYSSRLVDLEEENAKREAEKQKAEEIKELEKLNAVEEESPQPKNNEVTQEAGQEASADTLSDLATLLGMDGFDVSYGGSVLTEAYPEEQEDDSWTPTITASDEKLLFVVIINVTNSSAESKFLDIIDQNARFRLTLNGNIQSSALTTMLLNDLAYLKEDIPAGESRDYVLIAQIPKDDYSMDSVGLYARTESGSVDVKLQ